MSTISKRIEVSLYLTEMCQDLDKTTRQRHPEPLSPIYVERYTEGTQSLIYLSESGEWMYTIPTDGQVELIYNFLLQPDTVHRYLEIQCDELDMARLASDPYPIDNDPYVVHIHEQTLHLLQWDNEHGRHRYELLSRENYDRLLPIARAFFRDIAS